MYWLKNLFVRPLLCEIDAVIKINKKNLLKSSDKNALSLRLEACQTKNKSSAKIFFFCHNSYDIRSPGANLLLNATKYAKIYLSE